MCHPQIFLPPLEERRFSSEYMLAEDPVHLVPFGNDVS